MQIKRAKRYDCLFVQGNFSLIYYLAAPSDKRAGFAIDLEEVAQFQPHHVSSLLFDLPKGHHLGMKIAQPMMCKIEMFEQISSFFSSGVTNPMKFPISFCQVMNPSTILCTGV